MTTDLDLRPLAGEDRRQRLVSTLEDADSGGELAVRAEADLHVLFHQYQFEHEERLQWSREGTDEGCHLYRVTKGEAIDGEELAAFDVREMAPQRRHEVLLETFDRLDPGQGFVLVNDHDPKPLYHELRSTRGDVLDWEDRNRNPAEWTVAIVKTEAADVGGEGTVAARFDVREIPKEERHPTIHHRYGNLAPGETLEIVAPHQPRNLQSEFEQRYGDAYAWEVLEDEPGRCRVQVTKTDAECGADRAGDAGDDEALVDVLDVTAELDAVADLLAADVVAAGRPAEE